jgi:hypothetical protein
MKARRGTKANPFSVGEKVRYRFGDHTRGVVVGVHSIGEGGWDGSRPWTRMAYDVRWDTVGRSVSRFVASRDLESMES